MTEEEKAAQEAAAAAAKAEADKAEQDPLKTELDKVQGQKRTKLEKLQYRKKLIDEQQQKIQIQMKVINALRSDHEMPEGDDINDRHNVIGETPLHIGVFLLINIFFSNLK